MIVQPTATKTIGIMDMGMRSGTHRDWNRRPHPLYCVIPSWLLPPLEIVENNIPSKKTNGFS